MMKLWTPLTGEERSALAEARVTTFKTAKAMLLCTTRWVAEFPHSKWPSPVKVGIRDSEAEKAMPSKYHSWEGLMPESLRMEMR